MLLGLARARGLAILSFDRTLAPGEDASRPWIASVRDAPRSMPFARDRMAISTRRSEASCTESISGCSAGWSCNYGDAMIAANEALRRGETLAPRAGSE